MRKKKKKKKMTKSEFYGDLFLDSCVLSGTFVSVFCELLGSIILSACLVWGVVASLAVFLLVHQYGISKFP